jgi:hypothetical protein
MKNLLTLLLTISVLVFVSGASATADAQGKVPGASVGQGVSHDRDQVKAGSDAKGDQDSHTNWQTKFNERIQKHLALASRIDKLLPAGTDLKTAESGFKSPGQFIAALHVSRDLNIPFDQLKAKVTGVTMQATGQTTTTTPMSLGKAIHELRPNMTEDQANDAAKRAERQASETEKGDTQVGD